MKTKPRISSKYEKQYQVTAKWRTQAMEWSIWKKEDCYLFLWNIAWLHKPDAQTNSANQEYSMMLAELKGKTIHELRNLCRAQALLTLL